MCRLVSQVEFRPCMQCPEKRITKRCAWVASYWTDESKALFEKWLNELMRTKSFHAAFFNMRILVIVVGLTTTAFLVGCKGTGLTFPQSFGGANNASRVPAPATGSFQVPGSYSGSAGSPPATGLGSSSFSPGTNNPRTSQTVQPVSNFLGSLQNAQSQFRTVTNQAFDRANKASESAQSQVEQAGARIDRFGEGVVQAGAIVSDSLSAPIENGAYTEPNVSLPNANLPSVNPPSAGRIGDNLPSVQPTWRSPSKAPGK